MEEKTENELQPVLIEGYRILTRVIALRVHVPNIWVRVIVMRNCSRGFG